MRNHLLPCPFCNSSDLFTNRELKIECRCCGASGPRVFGFQSGGAKWNRRIPAPEAKASGQWSERSVDNERKDEEVGRERV